ncbi:hypothetical protein D9613_000710 [Agrocybe pediades]|uniref:Tyrosine--tRNA ligase n=1 Tax=Agrocybe pediades TaxID=84607 RepID=A0A8H4R344_9AGAR|nr:hypothetical protein D9613_000710 [Agrocybe pediades]KAF9566739.1 hypothetical protein CPC08DRAFT_703707 [Agrocybe pediades]
MWFRQRHGLQRFLQFPNKRQYHTPKPLLEDLTQRGFIQDVSRRDLLEQAIESRRQTVYVGVDPTARSLHIGHLIPLLCLLHFQLRGHGIVPLIGGATGRVGDPSGRLVERQLAEKEQIEANVVSLTQSIQQFFRNALSYATTRLTLPQDATTAEPRIVSNLEWHESFNLLDFLQQVGVHARVNTMLNRDSVRSRLSSQQGLSFTEFTYQLLQAYDFYHLHKHFGCTIQIGGSDQWGNIVAGLELIGKKDVNNNDLEQNPVNAFGITTPLLTTSTGEKFGKSAGNAVWLDSNLTSVFDFYQYFLKVTDADVPKYLHLFTLMSSEEIAEVLAVHDSAPEKRVAQHRLAAEVTEMVHTKSGVKQATVMTNLLFGSQYKDLKAEEVISAFNEDPRLVKTTIQAILTTPIAKLAAKHGLVGSNSAARNLVASRGLYLNGIAIQDAQRCASEDDLIDSGVLIIRAGKDKMMVLAATE